MVLNYDTTTQEYIKVIFELELEQRVARVTDIAERRGVTKPSVSLVLNQLQKKELIDRKQYGHITLTKTGRRLGNELYKRHQAITTFLKDVLGVPARIAEQDACKIEHDLSHQTWRELQRFVNVLQHCPRDRKKDFSFYTRCGQFAAGDLDCKTCDSLRKNKE